MGRGSTSAAKMVDRRNTGNQGILQRTAENTETRGIDMEWIKVEDRLPEDDTRVICYSPIYKDVNEEMLYRMLSGQIVRLCSDVEYWAIPEPPND